jgi:hypothetical protein
VSTLGVIAVITFSVALLAAGMYWVACRVSDAQRLYRTRPRRCFHHNIGGNPANTRTPISWIKQELTDLGRRKRFWCENCGRQWFT